MAKIGPNQPCPCGSEQKFKKCCLLYLDGKEVENAERLLRVRYSAAVSHRVEWLWESYHPESSKRLNQTWHQFSYEQDLLKNLDYQKLIILDGDVSLKDKATIVSYIKVFDGEQDLSYLEEAKFVVFEGRWCYLDGFRRSSHRLRIEPESIRVGDLRTLFPYDSGLN